ncbi:TetR/AcrR family transcriptional regulator [Pararhodobacter sp.]|uniref:TetR/AcrR family transcriptional regulator n=1 Tax=Pararhodobacter sp. TaxID=2127056 RepID=UPI002FE2FD3A|nr:TetR/AcrR family transcriptional regulator [Pseudomonadota bacterium]
MSKTPRNRSSSRSAAEPARPGKAKLDRQRRIREASRALFMSKGFEETTVREIAHMADVAQGTLFLFANSKRDLLFMLFNDVLEDATRDVQELAEADISIMEYLMNIALDHLVRLTDDLVIARAALGHLNNYDRSEQSTRFREIYSGTTGAIAQRFRQAGETGELRASFDPESMASMAQALIIESYRNYIWADIPDIRGAMRRLFAQIEVMLRGLEPSDKALSIASPALLDWKS